MKDQRPFLCRIRQLQSKTSVFWVKNEALLPLTNKQTNNQTIQNKRNQQERNITLQERPNALSLPNKTISGQNICFWGQKLGFLVI